MMVAVVTGTAAACAMASLLAAMPPTAPKVSEHPEAGFARSHHDASLASDSLRHPEYIVAVGCHKNSMRRSTFRQSASNPSSDESAFLRTLNAALGVASRIELFAFEAPCLKCGRANVTLSEVDRMGSPVLAVKESEQYLKAALLDSGSYLHGLRKPMPFVADYGLLIVGEKTSVAVLLSSQGQSVRLISSDTAVAPTPVLSLTNSGMKMLSHIQGVVQRPR